MTFGTLLNLTACASACGWSACRRVAERQCRQHAPHAAANLWTAKIVSISSICLAVHQLNSQVRTRTGPATHPLAAGLEKGSPCRGGLRHMTKPHITNAWVGRKSPNRILPIHCDP